MRAMGVCLKVVTAFNSLLGDLELLVSVLFMPTFYCGGDVDPTQR